MIGWIRLVDNESAIVAGSEVEPEGEVEAAIAFRGTLTWIFSMHITPFVAISYSRQEIEGDPVFLPNNPKQLSFENRLTDVITLTKAGTWVRVRQVHPEPEGQDANPF